MGSSLPQTRHTAELDSDIDGCSYQVEIAEKPFAKGSCRVAFMGIYRGRGPKNGERCVAKVAMYATGRHSAADYEADLRASRKADELAREFNRDVVSTKPLRFVLPVLATVLSATEDSLMRPRGKILVEDYIDGKYEKFNNNTSYHNDEVATVPCFSHYTYYKTGGQLLVCDIQGVRSAHGYWLTDPAVHSRRGLTYGDTDLGNDGVVRFFSSHRCTSVCVQFPISDFRHGRDLPVEVFDVTRKNYCGRRLDGPKCDCCDGTCGPNNGCNCLACMRRDVKDFQLHGRHALVNREGAVSSLSYETRKFYCGRYNMAKDRMTDGRCGPRNGNNCHACRQLDIQSRDRYLDIVQGWFSEQLPEPTSVIYRA